MAKKEFNFTKAKLDGLDLPAKGKRSECFDSKTTGLQLRMTATGVKTFCFYRWVKETQRPERVTLGRYPEMTIEQARKKATSLNAEVSDGYSPVDRIRAKREEMTFADLFDQYIERHSKPNKVTWQEDIDRYNLHLSKLSKKKLSSIKRADISRIHGDISLTHPTTANRILALASSIFGRAIEWGLWEGSNPATGIRRNREVSRDRFLQPDELPRFFKALSEEPNTTIRDFILIALLTGARRSNVLSMRWDQISFDRAEWRIPMTKNGTPQTIPLSTEAMTILHQRVAVSMSEYVLPGRANKGHLAEPKKGWERVLERAGIENLRMHDLRRTLGSWQARTGASLSIIGKSLNHKSPSTTAI
jgi:integrase